jgi:hypothetical protein
VRDIDEITGSIDEGSLIEERAGAVTVGRDGDRDTVNRTVGEMDLETVTDGSDGLKDTMRRERSSQEGMNARSLRGTTLHIT